MAICSIVGLTQAFEKLSITCERNPNPHDISMVSSTAQFHSSTYQTEERGSCETSEDELATTLIDVKVETVLPNRSFEITYHRPKRAKLLGIQDLCFIPVPQYSASRNKKPMIRKEANGTLSVGGVFFDRVVKTGQKCENFAFGRLKALREWHIICQTTAHNFAWREDFLKAVTGDLAYGVAHSGTTKIPVRAPLHQKDVFEAWSRFRELAYRKGSSGNDDVDNFDLLVTTMATGLRLFITEKGHVGIGHTNPGDEVWVLFGGDKPFILRRDPASESHWLVGDCFVHGIMDGEALQDWSTKTQVANLQVLSQ